MRIVEGELSHPAVQALIAEHLRDMHATSPPSSIHALDFEELKHDDVTLWTAWDDQQLLGCGALKLLGHREAEIKTMRTTPNARGRGVGQAMLHHVIDQARQRGIAQLSLETGAEDYFASARRLYARNGFAVCPPFGDYTDDPNSVFMTRWIGAEVTGRAPA